jgi:hypothetical protein
MGSSRSPIRHSFRERFDGDFQPPDALPFEAAQLLFPKVNDPHHAADVQAIRRE